MVSRQCIAILFPERECIGNYTPKSWAVLTVYKFNTLPLYKKNDQCIKGLFINDVITFGGYPDPLPPSPLSSCHLSATPTPPLCKHKWCEELIRDKTVYPGSCHHVITCHLLANPSPSPSSDDVIYEQPLTKGTSLLQLIS